MFYNFLHKIITYIWMIFSQQVIVWFIITSGIFIELLLVQKNTENSYVFNFYLENLPKYFISSNSVDSLELSWKWNHTTHDLG